MQVRKIGCVIDGSYSDRVVGTEQIILGAERKIESIEIFDDMKNGDSCLITYESGVKERINLYLASLWFYKE